MKTYLVAVFALASLLISGAASAEQINVSPIKVQGLGTYGGRDLNVYYVSGREGVIGSGGLIVRTVKAHVALEISNSGEVVVPATTLQKSGFEVINYVVFVVAPHSTRGAFLRNPDGSVPTDPRLKSGDVPAEYEFQIDRLAFDSLNKFKGQSGVVTVNYGELSN